MDPAAPGTPPRKGRHRIPLSGIYGGGTPASKKLIAISLVVAVGAAALLFGLASTGAKARMERSGHFDDEVVIEPGRTFSYIVSGVINPSTHKPVRVIINCD